MSRGGQLPRAADPRARGRRARRGAAPRPARWPRLGRATAWLGTVTPLGWSALVLGGVALGVGLWVGWAELVALGSVALAALAVAVVQSWGVATYAVDLDLASHRVTQGQRVYGRVRVRPVARRRALPATLELPVGSTFATFAVPALAPGAASENDFRIPTSRRTVLAVGPAATVRSDAFGLVRRRRTWTGVEEVVVHPRTVALGPGASGLLRDLEGGATPSLAEVSLEFHALREYVPGDDVRRIHWRSSARLGQTMVRQDEDVRRTRQVVTLATHPGQYRTEEEFELAVSVAASWVVQAVRDDRDVTLVAGRRLPAGTAVAALDALSAVTTEPSGPDAASATAWVAREVPDASLVVLVLGGAPSSAAVRAAVRVLPMDALVLAVTCDPGAPVEVATDGHQALVRCGDLTDLPGIVRRVLP